MQNRGGLGITERFLNLLLSHIKAEQWVYLGDFFAIPHSHIKSMHGFKLLQGSYSCHAMVILQVHPTGWHFCWEQKSWGDGQRCKTTAALGVLSFRPPTRIIWDLRELIPFWTPRDLHHIGRKSLWEAAMGNIFLCPGWLRTGHIHTPVPGLQQQAGKHGFLSRDKSKYHFWSLSDHFPSLEVFSARLDGALSSLVQWKVSLPGDWN